MSVYVLYVLCVSIFTYIQTHSQPYPQVLTTSLGNLLLSGHPVVLNLPVPGQLVVDQNEGRVTRSMARRVNNTRGHNAVDNWTQVLMCVCVYVCMYVSMLCLQRITRTRTHEQT
jgi:hypothetical protein